MDDGVFFWDKREGNSGNQYRIRVVQKKKSGGFILGRNIEYRIANFE